MAIARKDLQAKSLRLFEEYALTRSTVIRNQIVELHLSLAHYLAKRYSGNSDAEDLMQVAALALVGAAERFDTSRNVAFSTYATSMIIGSFKRYFRDKSWRLKVPRSVQELYGRLKEATARLTHEHHRSPTISELAADLEVSEVEVHEALAANSAYSPDSLDTDMTEDGGMTWGDALVSPYADGFEAVELRALIEPFIAELPDRQRKILDWYFWQQLTQVEIGRRLGISQMHTSRLLNRSLEQLKTRISAGSTATKGANIMANATPATSGTPALVTIEEGITRYNIQARSVSLLVTHLRNRHDLTSKAKVKETRARLFDPNELHQAAYACRLANHGFVDWVEPLLHVEPPPPVEAGHPEQPLLPAEPLADPDSTSHPSATSSVEESADTGSGSPAVHSPPPPLQPSPVPETLSSAAVARQRKQDQVDRVATEKGLMTTAQAAAALGLTYATLWSRLKARGYEPDGKEAGVALYDLEKVREALSKPAPRRRHLGSNTAAEPPDSHEAVDGVQSEGPGVVAEPPAPQIDDPDLHPETKVEPGAVDDLADATDQAASAATSASEVMQESEVAQPQAPESLNPETDPQPSMSSPGASSQPFSTRQAVAWALRLSASTTFRSLDLATRTDIVLQLAGAHPAG